MHEDCQKLEMVTGHYKQKQGSKSLSSNHNYPKSTRIKIINKIGIKKVNKIYSSLRPKAKATKNKHKKHKIYYIESFKILYQRKV